MTLAGIGTPGYGGDGERATLAELDDPQGVAVDSYGNIYIADTLNERIREVSDGGIISTVAGDGVAGYEGNGFSPATAELDSPTGVAVDAGGNIYIADEMNNVVREVPFGRSEIISAVGDGTSGYSGNGSSAMLAELSLPTGVAVDSAGDLYIADSNNSAIREVPPVTPAQTIYVEPATLTISANSQAMFTVQAVPRSRRPIAGSSTATIRRF